MPDITKSYVFRVSGFHAVMLVQPVTSTYSKSHNELNTVHDLFEIMESNSVDVSVKVNEWSRTVTFRKWENSLVSQDTLIMTSQPPYFNNNNKLPKEFTV